MKIERIEYGVEKPVAIEIVYRADSLVGSRPHLEYRLRLDFPLDGQMEKYVLEIIEEFGT